MGNKYSSLYRSPLPDFRSQLLQAIDRGCTAADKAPQVFFRADDVGVPSTNFSRLIMSFTHHNLPLCLAVVPTWTTRKRMAGLRSLTGSDSNQWCWHQHGRLHRNFEQTGRKQEFGPARSSREIFRHLKKGRSRMQELLSDDFTPVFTPPWNRCSGDTLQRLVELNFKAVSRNRTALPPSPPGLPDFRINVDLHTRKEDMPELALTNILDELEQGLGTGICGVMIHHQRMNQPAFAFLDLLLSLLKADKRIAPVHFGDLIG